jgi:hypothetical protein
MQTARHYANELFKFLFGLLGAFLLLILIVLLLSGIWLVGNTRVSRPSEFNTNRTKWIDKGVNDYQITLHHDGISFLGLELGSKTVLTVRDGQLISVESAYCEVCDLKTYQQFTVDGLFEKASECMVNAFCRIKYHPQYGFPSNIFVGTFGGGIVVSDFQFLEATK